MPGPGEIPGQTQLPRHPGIQAEMQPQPVTAHVVSDQSTGHPFTIEPYKAAGKLQNKLALITGGDSGIGRAVAVAFAKEGADVAIVYMPVEEKDAQDTKALVEAENKKCLLIAQDLREEANCETIIKIVMDHFQGRHLDILVNNAAEQHVTERLEDLSSDQLESTFRTNIFGMMYLTKYALPHMPCCSAIINSSSVVAYEGSARLVDYAATKGAIIAFTRSLARQVASRGIRVNAVAPGPIWTPLQAASRTEEDIEHWASKTPPLGRVGQPAECAPSYVFLASNHDGSYFTGQVLHPNGGMYTSS